METSTATPLQRIACALLGFAGTGVLIAVAIQSTLQHQWAELRPLLWPLIGGLCGGIMFLYIGITGRLPPFLDVMRHRNAGRTEALRQQLELLEKYRGQPLPRSARLRAGAIGLVFAALSGLRWFIPAIHWLPWTAFTLIAAVLLYSALSGRMLSIQSRRR